MNNKLTNFRSMIIESFNSTLTEGVKTEEEKEKTSFIYYF